MEGFERDALLRELQDLIDQEFWAFELQTGQEEAIASEIRRIECLLSEES